VRVLVPLLVAMPLLAAGVSMALWRSLVLQQVVGVFVVAAGFMVSCIVLAEVIDQGTVVVHLGGWEAPVGITLVADLLSMLLLTVALVTVLAVLVYAIGQPRSDKRAFYFHPLYLILTAGVSASFLTGDLFNLFVSFEIMLVASYVLITLGGGAQQVRSGMTYVVISLLASTLFVTAVGLVYAATGTVNLADLSIRIAELPDPVRNALGLLLLVVFGIKAAIFPLFFWLPDSYPTAPTPVTAIFAGLLTKVGVYAIIRTQTLLFPTADGGPSGLLLTIAGLTMVIGVLGAIAQDDVKRILSFHIVSQIGYMIFGLGLFSVAGVAGAIFFVTHQIVVKTSLFLVGGLVEDAAGTGALHRIGGLQRRAPAIAALFMLAALSLAGIPPFSGFVAKLSLVEAGLELDLYAIVAVSLAASVLTLFSMLKIWGGVFWGEPDEEPPRPLGGPTHRLRSPRLMLGATTAVVGLSLAIAVAAGPIFDLSQRAAASVVDPTTYVDAVLSP
jgi:multicomponent Na+:H+ antiporter subunit D